jgi:hypothetical protein
MATAVPVSRASSTARLVAIVLQALLGHRQLREIVRARVHHSTDGVELAVRGHDGEAGVRGLGDRLDSAQRGDDRVLDVEHHDFGLELRDATRGVDARPGLAHDVEAGPAERAAHRVGDLRVAADEQHPQLLGGAECAGLGLTRDHAVPLSWPTEAYVRLGRIEL